MKNCEWCNKKHNKNRFCSILCRNRYIASKNNNGGSIDKDGYKIIRILNKKYREHRYIIEIHLKRKLEKNEIVHHKDGNKLNNKIDNLEVIDRSLHLKKYHNNAWNKGLVTINAHICKNCHKVFKTIRQPKRKFCSRKCSCAFNNGSYEKNLRKLGI